jgi:hypothetical protein
MMKFGSSLEKAKGLNSLDRQFRLANRISEGIWALAIPSFIHRLALAQILVDYGLVLWVIEDQV